MNTVESGRKQTATPKWTRKPAPNTLRNLIRHSIKWTKKHPESWIAITIFAFNAVKDRWNITDEGTARKIADSIYFAAKEALEPRGKTPEDFIPEQKIQTSEFKPTKIEGLEPLPVVDKKEGA